MENEKPLYEGKAKCLYESDDPDTLRMHFKDDISAQDGKKLDNLVGKGEVNNRVNAFVMEKLAKANIATHFIKTLSSTDSLVKRLDMIPVECVVRNVAAGSICRRLGTEQGLELTPPIFEFFYKDDDLGDPLINDSHIETFKWASNDEVAQMKILSFRVNEVLKALFLDADVMLVDYKLEFGRYQGELVLGDEFTSDGCRIWDVNTKKTLDKDRFRQDMGDVVEAYQEVASRLGVEM